MATKIKNNRFTPNIKVACEECRSRKTRCDGARPACARCVKNGKHCEYDAEPDEFRITTLKRKCQRWEEQALAGEQLLIALRVQPEEEAVNLLRRLRMNENVEHILASLTTSGDRSKDGRGHSSSLAGSAPETSWESTPSRIRQQPEPQSDPIERRQRSTEVNKLAVEFLVNTADDTQRVRAEL